MKLQDRVAIVTGGGSGIGEAAVKIFASEGARVAVFDIDTEAARRVVEELETPGYAVVCDVSDSAAVDRAFSEVCNVLGPVDILVNNAGIQGRENVERCKPRVNAQVLEAASGRICTALNSTIEMTDREWIEMISIHLNGTFFCTRAALRSMVPRGHGTIVNIASVCGLVGCAGSSDYSAAKGGILAFTRAVAKEVIMQGVRVNCVAPGYVETPLLTRALTEVTKMALLLQTPQARLGTSEEIAKAILFLASDDSSFFVGETISPNGGFVTI